MGVGAMRLLSLPIGLSTSVILARSLGPEKFGQYAFLMALAPIFALPVSGGLQQLLTREVANYAHAESWGLYRGAVRTAHIWVTCVTGVLVFGYLTLKVGAGHLFIKEKWSLIAIALLLVPFSGFAAVRLGVVKGLGFPAYAELPIQLIQPIIVLGLSVIFLWTNNLHLEVALWNQVSAAFIVFVIASWMFLKIQPNHARESIPAYKVRTWGKSLLPFSLIAMVTTLNAQIGIIFLGTYGADDQVAALRIGERGGQLVALSLTLVNMIAAPYIVRTYKSGNKNLLQQLVRNIARGSFLFSLPIAVLLVVYGEWLIGYVFGEDFSGISYWPLVVIVAGQVINVFFGPVANVLSMSGFEKDTLKGQAIAILCNVVLCILLVPRLGALGAAIGVTISIVVWNLFLYIMVRGRIGINSSVL